MGTELPAVAQAFEPGAQARDRQVGEVTFWTRTVGDLIVPTGRIVACDPFQCIDAPAFAREVPQGAYPVLVALAQFVRTGGERIVGAMLRLHGDTPARWEPAALVREASDASHPDRYCVDSGFGAFMDEAAIEALIEHIDADDDDDYLQRRLDSLRPAGGPEWFDIPLDEDTGANMLLFTSGWGDGAYPCYWGYAADGSLVCLVTDFGVLSAADFL